MRRTFVVVGVVASLVSACGETEGEGAGTTPDQTDPVTAPSVPVSLNIPAFDFPSFGSVTELAARADHVVIAVADSVGEPEALVFSSAGPDIAYPMTPVTFSVIDVLVGTLEAGQQVIVVEDGGTIGTTTMDLPESPITSAGSTMLLFLDDLEDGSGRFNTVGAGSGRLAIQGDEIIPSKAAGYQAPTDVELVGLGLAGLRRLLSNADPQPTTSVEVTPRTTAPAIDG